ncbi:MAG: APC family permease [Tuberibacillus sp.]
MNKLRRELSSWHGYATVIGGMIGSGLFVVTGQAGAKAGPSVPFGYIALLPVLLASALAYLIFLSSPLGNKPGGAYVHISRTFQNHFIGFIFMWFQYIALIGVMAVVALSFSDYITSLLGTGHSLLLATGFVLVFYLLNLIGVKWFGRIQLWMSVILMVAIAILVLPGLFSINLKNYTPLLPHGWHGFFSILPSLFFAYFGFEQLAQTGGEMKNPQKALPRTMLRGALITMGIYFLVSGVAFGILPADVLAKSKSAMADVAAVYLPGWAKWIVVIGIIMAFATTLNSILMVASRMLFSFAEDRTVPSILAGVNKKFGTPHLSLTVNTLLVLGLIWTKTFDVIINISLQGMFLMYIGHAIAMIALPYVRPALLETALLKPSKKLMMLAGVFALIVLVYFSYHMILSVIQMLIIWAVIGAILFGIGKWEGKIKGFDYKANLQEDWVRD